MEEQQIFVSILALSLLEFSWELFLALRQHKVYLVTEKIPDELAEVLDENIFQKSRSYSLDKSSFSIIKSIYGTMLGTGIMWYMMLYHIWEKSKSILANFEFEENEILTSALFIILLNTINFFFSLPLKIYDTFVIEQKHGFNNQTVPFFIKDKILSYTVLTVLVVPLTCIAIYIVKAGGEYFFLYLWLFAMVTLFFLMSIYPDFIAPLFDKYTPLPEGELKEKIEELAAKVKFPLYKLYLVEGSKRSVHSNAYFYGFFKNKRIVLFDTLLKSEKNGDKGCDNNEILAILAHELGHWKFNHVTKNILIMQVNLFLQFFAFGILFKYPQLYKAFGFQHEQPIIIGLIIVLQFVFAPYNSIMTFFLTILSRKFEFQADNFAKQLGKTKYLRQGLIKLHKDNLSFPVFDWLYSSWHHSHPPLLQRLRALDDKED
ncbi:CAAX prenyl protease 1 homolog isoform X2 [Cimex lectularius]|uniref:CAAX prenyl protease n=1 Tax=Cimex lectularius TaxID=79782 RepID=A0A8I6REX8_CIMLE|nr:CAAX prenyl protease 1 homolog isoform X2 [Cimex lectularius]